MRRTVLVVSAWGGLVLGCGERKAEVSPSVAEAGPSPAEAAEAAKKALAEAEQITQAATGELKKATLELQTALSQRVAAADQRVTAWEGQTGALGVEQKKQAEQALADAKRHSASAKLFLARLETASTAALAETQHNAENEVRELDKALARAARALGVDAG